MSRKAKFSMRMIGLLIALAVGGAAVPALGEDGHDLWLRAAPLPASARIALQREAGTIGADASGPTARLARDELRRGLSRLGVRSRFATPGASAIRLLRRPDAATGTEGFAIRTGRRQGRIITTITAETDTGLLYGVFHYLRLAASGADLAELDVRTAPRLKLRVLDHWDNLDGVVERGYAGRSIWDWWRLPDWRDPIYTEYARANASLGINGTVVNNVNAKSTSLTPAYIAKLAALADVLRPWSIKTYLSVRWTAPMELGGLKTADPLDPAVAAWWRAKADEIYAAIPDFGGFLVKANSEGQPGPQDYHRSHADGANMLAAALKPHGGVVMWRAFVYAHDNPEDRAKQAYDDFRSLDGQFADNVLVQVKNGAIDFQPREPFHPLFGAMPHTNLMIEFQITKEYLGQSTHLTYLGPLFAETLHADTMAHGAGSTVARIIDGSLEGRRLTGMAGVANIGADRDWTGSIFNQADWYAFGRLAWDPDLSSAAIAREWVAQTFGTDPAVGAAITGMMLSSREAAVNYMTPLGLAHVMGTGHHYGPAPWVSDLARPEWNPVYYHKADTGGIGFARGPAGSNAVAQYAAPLARALADPATTDERTLLWFHHLPWTYRLASGDTLWNGMVRRYDAGVAEVAWMRAAWGRLQPHIDAERFAKTRAFLEIQQREAQWWRDASIAYFQSINHLPLPPGSTPPHHDLAHYKALTFPFAPGNP